METLTNLTIHDIISIAKARDLGYEKLLLKPLSSTFFNLCQSNAYDNQVFVNHLFQSIQGEVQYEVYPHLVVPVYNKWLCVQAEERMDLILDACIDAEMMTFKAYLSSLNTPLPAPVYSLVKNELEGIKKIIFLLNQYKSALMQNSPPDLLGPSVRTGLNALENGKFSYLN